MKEFTKKTLKNRRKPSKSKKKYICNPKPEISNKLNYIKLNMYKDAQPSNYS